MFWVSSGQYGGHMQVNYRYWMEYSDMEVAAGYTSEHAFDPEHDYAKPADHPKPADLGW